MIFRLFSWFAAVIALGWCSWASAAKPGRCDAVLVQQYEVVRTRDSAQLAWLSIIDEQSYSKAKASAGASAYGGLFSGDYTSFDVKRREYFAKYQYAESRDSAREELKAYLSPEQISAWVTCQGAQTELIIYYKDVEPTRATVVMTWVAPDDIGALRNISVLTDNASLRTAIGGIPNLRGNREFQVSRTSPRESIRGSVSGVAGANAKSYSASVFIAPERKTIVIIRPQRTLVSKDGAVLTSIAYWGKPRRGRPSKRWDCTAPSEGMDLIVVETANRILGKRRGQCVGPGDYCDDGREGCVDVVIRRGCFVNREWHDWYKADAKRRNMPYSKAAVCEPTPT